MKIVSFVFCSLLVVKDTVLGAETEHASSVLAFKHPKAIANDHVAHHGALFGVSNFGKGNQLVADVFVDKNPDLKKCPTIVDPVSNPGIIVYEGYTCTFIAMALNAQARGATGMIVVQDKCLKSNVDDSTVPEPFKTKYCSSTTIQKLNYMGGSSDKINIPAVLVPRYDGFKLIECAQQRDGTLSSDEASTKVVCQKDDSVTVSLAWAIPQKQKVRWTLWSSSLLNADIFTKPYWYEKIMPKMIGKTIFEPRYFVWDGKILRCDQTPSECGDACHNKGKYCHYDPDGLNQGPLVGREISRENMRQYCAFQQVKDDVNLQLKWWKYVSLVADTCTEKVTGKKEYYTESCSKEAHKAAGLDYTATMTCISTAGGYGIDDADNSLWKEELEARKGLAIERLPTLVVNGVLIDFNTHLKNVLESICAAFVPGYGFDFCDCVSKGSKELNNDENLVKICFDGESIDDSSDSKDSSGGVGFGTIFFILLIVGGGLVGTYVVVRRDRSRYRHEVREEVRNIVGEYMRMDQDDTEDSSGSFIGERIASIAGNSSNGDSYKQVELQ